MKVVIFSADIGAGHDLPARVLRDAIVDRRPDAEATIVDTLACAGPVARAVVRDGLEVILQRLPWLYDAEYWLIARFPPTRALMRRLSTRLARRGLLRAVADHEADVVVCTYPGANEVLSTARRAGRLDVPVVSAITDLAALQYWAHAGTDLHLVIHPESVAEIRAIAGPGARIAHVRGLTHPDFEAPVDEAGVRASFGIDGDAHVIVVSGGGWGVGDLQGAVRAARDADGHAHVIALCGNNTDLQERLARTVGDDRRVHVLGFTTRMSDILGVADVLVHATAGLTVLEALVRGTRVISYGWGYGHIRLNNAAYRSFGLADVVAEAEALTGAIRAALAAPRAADTAYARLPHAADAVIRVGADRS